MIKEHSSMENTENEMFNFDSSHRFIEKLHNSSLEASVRNTYLEGKFFIKEEISDAGPLTRILRPCSMNEDSLAMYQNK